MWICAYKNKKRRGTESEGKRKGWKLPLIQKLVGKHREQKDRTKKKRTKDRIKRENKKREQKERTKRENNKGTG